MIWKVYEILPATGVMTAAEILPRLRPATVRWAVEHREPLTAGTLRKNMAGRVLQGW